MTESTYFLSMLVLTSVFGYTLARWRYRRLLEEQHMTHELCEDAAYSAGLARGRREQSESIGDGDAWYRKGFKEGRRHERALAEKRLNELGLRKN